MTKELKTLKDLGFFTTARELPFFKKVQEKAFLECELKQEAIKWVKMIQSGAGDGFMYMAIFKKFFNLTEDDLK